MASQDLIALVTQIADPGSRPSAIKQLAVRLGGSDLLIFIEDRNLRTYLPAPGFPQSIPEVARWQQFLGDLPRESRATVELVSPFNRQPQLVHARKSRDGSILATLGTSETYGKAMHPEASDWTEALDLLPLLVASLKAEFAVTASAVPPEIDLQGKLEFALRSAKMGTWDLDIPTDRISCSQEMLDLWGVSSEEFKNQRDILQSKVHPDDRPKMNAAIKHSIQTTQVYELEYRIRPRPGQEKWVLSRGRCVYDQTTERPTRFSGVVFDITERKKVEEATRQALSERDRSLETLSTINEVGRKISAELELEKLVQQVTDAATKLSSAQFGAFFYNNVDSEGRSYQLYTISGAPKEAFSRFPQPRATKVFHPTFQGEATVRSEDITRDPRYGQNAPYFGMPKGHLPVRSYLAVPVVSRNGEVLGGLFFGHEKPGIFTEQAQEIVEGLASQAAVALDNARLYRRLQESVRARDEFLSIASHELKTPLTSLTLQTQMRARILDKGDLGAFTEDRLRKMIQSDSRQVERLTRLIDDMLDISRINTGKLAIHLETFDLCALTQDALERHRPQFEAASTPVILNCREPVEGRWDRFRIEQVITNLLTNAIRYGKRNPVEIQVSREGRLAVLSVRDRGIGIAKENLSRIFERFERAISANEISGLGLGLYIVKQIVEMHGGSIRVESELGTGSTFTAELPIEPGMGGSANSGSESGALRLMGIKPE